MSPQVVCMADVEPVILEDRFGIACNYLGDRHISPGALAFLAIKNGGGERWEFAVQSRGGRMIRKYLRLDRCREWRVKWIPLRHRRKGATGHPDRDAAQAELERWAPE